MHGARTLRAEAPQARNEGRRTKASARGIFRSGGSAEVKARARLSIPFTTSSLSPRRWQHTWSLTAARAEMLPGPPDWAGPGLASAGGTSSGLAGALGGADQRPSPLAPGRSQRPAPPGAPRLARASRSPVDPPDLCCPGHPRTGLACSRIGFRRRAPRAARVQYRVPACGYARRANARARHGTRRHAAG